MKLTPLKLIGLLLLIWLSLSWVKHEQTNAKFKGIKQVGNFNTKNGYGSDVRVYSFYTNEQNFDLIKEHAQKQPYTQNGETTVFYFNDRNNTPDVSQTREQFDKKYEPYCLAAFWKFPKGNEEFVKYPFKNK